MSLDRDRQTQIYAWLKKILFFFLPIPAGTILDFAFSPWNIWPLLFIGLIVWAYILKIPAITENKVSIWYSMRVGFFLGLGFFIPVLSFTRIVAGDGVWIAFGVFEAFYIALWAGFSAWISNKYYDWAKGYRDRSLHYKRKITRKTFFLYQAILSASLIVYALVFTMCERIRSIIPFHGFPWMRISYATVYSPFISLAPYLGESALTWLIVSLSFLLLFMVLKMRQFYRVSFVVSSFLHVASGAAVVVLVYACIVLYDRIAEHNSHITEKFTIGYIQAGNLESTHSFYERQLLVKNYWQKTKELIDYVHQNHRERPDLILWPENSSDIDPFVDPQVWTYINQSAQMAEVPLALGTLINNADGKITNTIILWDPNNPPNQLMDISGKNIYILQRRHDKIHLQPFGEYMPWQSLFRNITTKVDLANHLSPGNDSGIIRVGSTKIGVAICYEVGFDDFYHTIVNNGANIFVVPTNNATFGYSHMSYLQLAISQFRAVEFNREVAVAATTGVSGFIDEQGKIFDQSHIGEQEFALAALRVHHDKTWAAYLYPWEDIFLFILLISFIYLCWKMSHKERESFLLTYRREEF